MPPTSGISDEPRWHGAGERGEEAEEHSLSQDEENENGDIQGMSSKNRYW